MKRFIWRFLICLYAPILFILDTIEAYIIYDQNYSIKKNYNNFIKILVSLLNKYNKKYAVR